MESKRWEVRRSAVIVAVMALAVVILFLERNRQASHSGPSGNPPEWARFFDKKGWADFRGLVLDYCRAKGLEVTLDEAGGVLHAKNGNQLGLQNIAQLCAQSERGEWEKLIKEHFDRLNQLDETNREVSRQVESYEQAEKMLAVRLFPQDYLDQLGQKNAIFRKDMEGVFSTLVFDLPTMVQNVKPEEARKWGKTDDELLKKGLANVLKNYKPEVSRQRIKEGIDIWLFTGEDLFVATHALLLEHHPDCIGEYGALVGIPTRHCLICFPIDSINVLQAVNALIVIINDLAVKGPGSITANLYWYDKGIFTHLPYKLAGKTLQFFPPDSFTGLLNRLAGQKEK